MLTTCCWIRTFHQSADFRTQKKEHASCWAAVSCPHAHTHTSCCTQAGGWGTQSPRRGIPRFSERTQTRCRVGGAQTRKCHHLSPVRQHSVGRSIDRFLQLFVLIGRFCDLSLCFQSGHPDTLQFELQVKGQLLLLDLEKNQ